jgi:hypothetical protein
LAGVAACAHLDSELAAARESWRGASYDDVVAVWGPPNRIVKSGSQENHTWITEDRVERGGGGTGVFGGIGVGRGGVGVGVGMGGGAIFGPGAAPVRCERTLMISDARVVGEDWNGDAEFCKRFARPRR